MLKLVDAEQVIADIGCRVSEDTFVLMLEEVKEQDDEGISE